MTVPDHDTAVRVLTALIRRHARQIAEVITADGGIPADLRIDDEPRPTTYVFPEEGSDDT